MMTVRLVNDVYPLIYAYLDSPSKAMFAFSCKRFLKLGIPQKVQGIRLSRESARYGYLEIIQWARKYKTPMSVLSCELAAKFGHFETLKWLRENGAYWDSDTCSNAAKGGHLEIIQWARREGCSWSELTCYCAAKYGRLKILQWLYVNHCPWYLNEILDVANPEILEWIRGLGVLEIYNEKQ